MSNPFVNLDRLKVSEIKAFIKAHYPKLKITKLRKKELLDLLKQQSKILKRVKKYVPTPPPKPARAIRPREPPIRDNKYSKYPVYVLKRLAQLYNPEPVPMSKFRKNDYIRLVSTLDIADSELPTIARQSRMSAKPVVRKMEEEDQAAYLQELEAVPDPTAPKKAYIKKDESGAVISETMFHLQEHQKRFIVSFINANTTGCILFHSVGSGKTLTAVVYSHYYLSLLPDHNVCVISPPALLMNFVNGMYYYGLRPDDRRYTFETYEKFCKDPEAYVDGKTLLIIDEAHNFRTVITSKQTQGGNVQVTSNKRGATILKRIIGSEAKPGAHKILLLTGTPFINMLYDIENIVSMADKKEPLPLKEFNSLVEHRASTQDYFKYRLSHFDIFNTPSKVFFPTVKMVYVPLKMDDNMERIYDEVRTSGEIEDPQNDEEVEINKALIPTSKKAQDDGGSGEGDPNAFYNKERRIANMVGGLKVKFVIDKIKEEAALGHKSIIYTTFINSSLVLYTRGLREAGIQFRVISGSESAKEKEEARVSYNENPAIMVLVISKAGTEGVDTKNTRNVFVIEALWNEASAEQAIARAVRFKSHMSLPEDERIVDVYRLLVCKKSGDEGLIEKLNEAIRKNAVGKLNFTKITGMINKSVREMNAAIAKEKYDQSLAIEKLGGADFKHKFKLHMDKQNEDKKRQWKASRPGIGRKKAPFREFTVEKEQQIKENFAQEYAEREFSPEIAARYKMVKEAIHDTLLDSSGVKGSIGVDVMLTFRSLKKMTEITAFVEFLDANVHMVEDYKSEHQQKIIKMIEDGAHIKDIMAIQREDMTKERNKVIAKGGDLQRMLMEAAGNQAYLKEVRKAAMASHIKTNEFFTPPLVVKQMLDLSTMLKARKKIVVLEPTAGSGNIVLGITERRKDPTEIYIDMCEINPVNRRILGDLVKASPHILNLNGDNSSPDIDERMKVNNFLNFKNNKEYDLIVMNPPFHIKKDLNVEWTNKDLWDVDFVKHAYHMLREGGELIALIGGGSHMRQGYAQWFESVDTAVIDMPGVKWEASKEHGKKSAINKINLSLLRIIKLPAEERTQLAEKAKEKYRANPGLRMRKPPIFTAVAKDAIDELLEGLD